MFTIVAPEFHFFPPLLIPPKVERSSIERNKQRAMLWLWQHLKLTRLLFIFCFGLFRLWRLYSTRLTWKKKNWKEKKHQMHHTRFNVNVSNYGENSKISNANCWCVQRKIVLLTANCLLSFSVQHTFCCSKVEWKEKRTEKKLSIFFMLSISFTETFSNSFRISCILLFR